MHHKHNLLDLPALQINLHSTFVIKKTVLPRRIPFRRHNIENKSVCSGVTRTRKRFKCHFLCYFTNRCGDIFYVPFLVTSSVSDTVQAYRMQGVPHMNMALLRAPAQCIYERVPMGRKQANLIVDAKFLVENWFRWSMNGPMAVTPLAAVLTH